MMAGATFSRYLMRQFLVAFLGLLAILAAIIWLFEFVEMIRRAGGSEEATIGIALSLTLLKLPRTVELVFPFAILFSAMFTFWRLTRSHELVVVRAAGVSVWQFLAPVVIATLLIGGFRVGIYNPVSAQLYGQFDRIEARYLHGRDSLLDVGPGGLWLRQRTDDGTAAIFAEGVAAESITLDGVVIHLYGAGDRYAGRVDAATAHLRDGFWQIDDAWLSEPGQPSERIDDWQLETDLTPDRIQDSFAPPETLSFWELPAFIGTLEATGFSATRHRLHFQSLLAQPALMAAMVLFGAIFTLRQQRRGGTLAMVVAGVLTGFLLFVLNDVVTALGLAETIPVPLAAWTPAAISLAVATSGLFYLEDG